MNESGSLIDHLVQTLKSGLVEDAKDQEIRKQKLKLKEKEAEIEERKRLLMRSVSQYLDVETCLGDESSEESDELQDEEEYEVIPDQITDNDKGQAGYYVITATSHTMQASSEPKQNHPQKTVKDGDMNQGLLQKIDKETELNQRMLEEWI